MPRVTRRNAAVLLFGNGVIPPKPKAPVKPKCSCGNVVENRWGTCDECQDAAYSGDGFGRW